MTEMAEQHTADFRGNNVEQYYRFHAPIYDATRWSFLFGRKAILNTIPNLPPEPNILEIGCGTGYNIRQLLDHFPDAHIVGVDLSASMLKEAQNKLKNTKRVELLEAQYGSDPLDKKSYDLILLSYSMTMMNQQYEDLINDIIKNLSSDGIIAVVDFHNSPFEWFRQWMNMNHVDMNGELFSLLLKHFFPVQKELKQAYGGLWSYFKFVGRHRRKQ